MSKYIQKLKSFIKQCRRILTIASKPSKEEYMEYTKVITIGVLLLGAIGFILYAIFSFI
ncbi:MAG: protein translocase SEC61 complex subunit gamma [Candidatus Aenigmarchaeota archaeon ex4484_56]|nr:MAG: protein translocase SEC61 complex subunit gamma [Candidatus Aenigmarchaeota archaeon ex4484_56]